MVFEPGKPVIVQSDSTVLLEVDSPEFEQARDCLSSFADLVKSPEHIHTYRITPLSLWNAASAGLNSNDILGGLRQYSRYEIPENIEFEIRSAIERYGKIILNKEGEGFSLFSEDPLLISEIWTNKSLKPFFDRKPDNHKILLHPLSRGPIKQALIRLGFPVKDVAGYVRGTPLDLELRARTLSDEPFQLRDYQIESVRSYYRDGSPEGGSGVIVLPCGAGKTIVGLAAMAQVKSQTLILATNIIAPPPMD